jgi:hypothetical protein
MHCQSLSDTCCCWPKLNASAEQNPAKHPSLCCWHLCTNCQLMHQLPAHQQLHNHEAAFLPHHPHACMVQRADLFEH